MAKRTRKKNTARSSHETTAEPKYPYCVAPKSLRRLLSLVPDKPRPPKVNSATIKGWGFKSGNDVSVLRVLKAVDLLGASGETTQTYADFMKKDSGPEVLGKKIRSAYASLFDNVKNPEKAPNSELISFFNIHSGGSASTIRYQVDTFKALAEHATFGGSDPLAQSEAQSAPDVRAADGRVTGEPVIRIDLHIHLPENKSKSDYDALLESIATHLYRRAP
jgi:hypothetical protein